MTGNTRPAQDPATPRRTLSARFPRCARNAERRTRRHPPQNWDALRPPGGARKNRRQSFEQTPSSHRPTVGSYLPDNTPLKATDGTLPRPGQPLILPGPTSKPSWPTREDQVRGRAERTAEAGAEHNALATRCGAVAPLGGRPAQTPLAVPCAPTVPQVEAASGTCWRPKLLTTSPNAAGFRHRRRYFLLPPGHQRRLPNQGAAE